LCTVHIGDGVQTIGEFAFDGCVQLLTVRLGKKVKSIGHQAFYYCRGLVLVELAVGERADAWFGL
jgi:hypothetical protein